MPLGQRTLEYWPQRFSSMLACLGCTLGLFNICRFAILTVHLGANFIYQFFVISLILGWPLFTFNLCLGQQLEAGIMNMWSISPLFLGVGISLLLANTLLGIYSIVGISWLLVYFKDSFISKSDHFRWSEPYLQYHKDMSQRSNVTYSLSETISDYFNGIVLQRQYITSSGATQNSIKFQTVFNLVIVWMIVFVSLSKGLRSYGRAIFIFTIVPILGTFILCAKFFSIISTGSDYDIFPKGNWNEFFFNSNSWLAAAQESFLTWGLLGAATMQISSHNNHSRNLQKDSTFVIIATSAILLLFAFLANSCAHILQTAGFSYVPDSFEYMSSFTFIRSIKEPLPPSLAKLPVRYMTHQSFVIGETVKHPGMDLNNESGYQVLRYATELVPATLGLLDTSKLSPLWAVLFYLILIMFGICQQLAIWYCLISGIVAINAQLLKSWQTTMSLVTCVFGFLLGLPLATESGMYLVYFMDSTVGGLWWIIVVILFQIVAVFMVRGRPYSGDNLVTALFSTKNVPCTLNIIPGLLSFTWNVILPVLLMVLCITSFRNGNYREIFIWHQSIRSINYWPVWVRKFGCILQLIHLFLIPFVGIIQVYRYLNNGPTDILDRIQLLYRPPIGEHMVNITSYEQRPSLAIVSNTNNAEIEDAPPKYTPPPSYSTATGARIAKFLRKSFRHSMRRIRNTTFVGTNNSQTNTSITTSTAENAETTIEGVSTLERLRNVETSSRSPALTAAEVASILRKSFRGKNMKRKSLLPMVTSAPDTVNDSASSTTRDTDVELNIL